MKERTNERDTKKKQRCARPEKPTCLPNDPVHENWICAGYAPGTRKIGQPVWKRCKNDSHAPLVSRANVHTKDIQRRNKDAPGLKSPLAFQTILSIRIGYAPVMRQVQEKLASLSRKDAKKIRTKEGSKEIEKRTNEIKKKERKKERKKGR